MKTIYKYTLKFGDCDILQLPKDAEILSCQFQGKDICLWAMVDPKAEATQRVFAIYGTGHPIPHNPHTFIATVQQPNSIFVWHIFEITQ